MGFGNVGGGEILVILLVALLILGPTKLPEVARQAGRAMAELRKVTAGFQRELDNAMHDDSDARARGAALAATQPAPPSDDPAPAEPAPTAVSDSPSPESDTDR